MKKYNLTLSKSAIALSISLSCSALFAAGIADVSFNGDSLSLSPTVSFDAAGLRVSGNSNSVTQVFQSGDDISMSLSGMGDGMYSYELDLSSESDIDAAGDEGANIPPDATQSGRFRVVNGVASAYNETVAKAEAVVIDAQRQLDVAAEMAAMEQEK